MYGLEIHIALSNPDIDVTTLAQGYCVTRKALLIKQETVWMEWFCSFLLIPSILE